MQQTLSFRHSYNLGDLISVLPGIRHLCLTTGKKAIICQRLNLPAHYYAGEVHSTRDEDGQGVCFNEDLFFRLQPLLQMQDYIESFRIWKGDEVDYDLDKTRDRRALPLPYGPLHYWPSLVFPELACDMTEPWLQVPLYEQYWLGEPKPATILVNVTERYRNPYVSYHFLRRYAGKAVIRFVGTAREYEKFCRVYELNIAHQKVNNFLELAVLINSCSFFVGNQSFCWHLAEALKVPRILEVCAEFPNTWPFGPNGHAVCYQEHLQLKFSQLYHTHYECKESEGSAEAGPRDDAAQAPGGAGQAIQTQQKNI